jgi:hypothetical protein
MQVQETTQTSNLELEPGMATKAKAFSEKSFLLPEEDPDYWVSQNGSVTKITSMTASHIMHAIRKFEVEGNFEGLKAERYANLLKVGMSMGIIKSIHTVLL